MKFAIFVILYCHTVHLISDHSFMCGIPYYHYAVPLCRYSDCLGFSEIMFVNTEGNKGFVLEGSNGMRLSAMQYWMCSEVCVGQSSPDVGVSNGEMMPAQLIFAEPLHNSGTVELLDCVYNYTCS